MRRQGAAGDSLSEKGSVEEAPSGVKQCVVVKKGKERGGAGLLIS